METLKINKKNAQALYPKAAPEFKAMLEDTFGKEYFSQKITDRVKTFEDACEVLGLHPENVLPFENPTNKRKHAMNDIARLDAIAEALQEGWQANWANSNEYKWRPWFEYEGAGFGFSDSDYDDSRTFTAVGSRLCFPTEELSNYFGKQFIEIHNRLLTNNY